MELRHLRYFVAVAETQNISRAALKLRVSQPALSRQIRDLEDELGFLLLERTGRSVRLTDAGRVFLTEGRAVLERARVAVEIARGRAASGRELQLGYAPSLTARILPAALRAFQQAEPEVRVKLHDMSTGEMLEALREGKLGIALIPAVSSKMMGGLRFEKLTHDVLCLAVRNDHPLARQPTVTVEQAAREPLIAYNHKDYPEAHELLNVLFARSKIKPRIVEEHESVSSLVAAVEAGVGATVAGKSLVCVAGTRLKLIPFAPEPPPLIVGAALLRKGTSREAQRFLECAKEVSGRFVEASSSPLQKETND